jgi:hypothetical protein
MFFPSQFRVFFQNVQSHFAGFFLLIDGQVRFWVPKVGMDIFERSDSTPKPSLRLRTRLFTGLCRFYWAMMDTLMGQKW